MQNIFFSCGLAFLITFFSIPAIIEVAESKNLYDEPEGRKVHKTVIPTLGGLGIFAGFIIATLMGVNPSMSGILQYILAAGMILFFIGIKDDILVISASKKFIGQLLAAIIIIKFADINITNMYGFLGVYELSPTVSVLLSVFTIVVIINSFNLIDGVDGLAGSLSLLTSLIFGFYFWKTGQDLYAVMAFSLTGSLIAFLIFNFNPARIFMGDTGSLLIGLLNSIFVIKFISLASDPQSAMPLQSAPAIGFAILIVPLFDTLRVFTMRILKRRSPFSPDKNHIHHFLLDLGFGHRAIVFLCVAANIFFIAIAYFLRSYGTTIAVSCLTLISISIVTLIYYSRPKKRVISLGQKSKKSNISVTSSKVLSFNGEPVKESTSL
ncbi:MAG: MraY family glycosyltransferase [Ginsengibacter sp.]